jgi:4-alpha-glucanotransferase
MSGRFAHGRHAGVIVPLFSIPSARSWGIGEIPDLPHLARWLTGAGLDFVQLLPINEMQGGQSSPYSALTAMAIDPIFVGVEAMEDFHAAGGVESLQLGAREALAIARRAQKVDYAAVRAAKSAALRVSFQRFAAGVPQGSPRGHDFETFATREAWWLETYALFRALHDEHQGAYWREWEDPLRDRDPGALEATRARLASAVRYYQYLQWIADDQWRRARRDCGSVGLFGDFPFMVNGHSADVWARQREFHLDASVGAPPAPGADDEGQDWGLPPYRWAAIAPDGYVWLGQRARRSAELFDAFRIDHLVGFYRTFIRRRDRHKFFSPADEPSQIRQGEALMALFSSYGARLIAEDLGVVPDIVRESQTRLGVAGLKILRWEREWTCEGQPFRDPRAYPSCSVAMSSTHDTESMADWWDGAGEAERRAVIALPDVRAAGIDADAPFSPMVRDALLSTLFHSGSDFALIALPDVFGWRDRINTPNLVGEENWTWRLPWPVEELMTDPVAVERARFLHGLIGRSGRTSA